MNKREFTSQSEKDTRDFAKEVLKRLKPGDALALFGDLGTGKTVFVKGLAEALGVKEEISSPTFVILRRYKTANKKIKFLNHIDLYRLEGKNLDSINFKDLLQGKDSVLVIEWAERAGSILPRNIIKVYFSHIEENTRKIILITNSE